MHKNKLLNILDTLSEKEFKSLGKFINSPFFNESRKMAEMYELLKKYYLNNNFEKLTPEIISNQIYKSGRFDTVKTRKLISDFNALLESFLIHQSVEKDTIGKKAYLSEQLSDKELNKLYDMEMGDIKRIMNNTKWDSKSYYFSKLRLINEELTAKIFQLSPEKQIDNIKAMSDTSDRLYIFMKLYEYHIIIQNNLFHNNEITDYGFVNMNKLFAYLEDKIEDYEKNEPRIYLFFLILKLIKERKIDKIYAELEEYIQSKRVFLSPDDIEFNIYTIITYIVAEISSGKYENIGMAIEVFKKIEAKGFLNRINDFNYYIFVQIVNFAVHIKDIEYAESFIWRYYSKVNSIFKEDSLNLALATLMYAQGRYEEARDLIKKVNYKTYGFYLLSHSLLLRIYYDENSLKYILPAVDSFKHFLKRNKNVPLFLKESFTMFLNYLTRLTSLKKEKMKDVYKLEFILSKEKNFYGKKWIEEKLTELMK